MFDHDLCPDKHTPLCPGKTRARQWWMKTTPLDTPVLTISPGALDAFRWMNWAGPIFVCDICRPCVLAAARMRRHYKELQIKAPLHMTVQDATRRLARKAPVIDCDLAFQVRKAAPILTDILQTLVDGGIHTRVLLTYVNHRDGFSTVQRVNALKAACPRGAEYVESYNYASVWSKEDHDFSKGSAMAVADIRT